jgi:phospholipid-binding lipoprotein MlaA
MLNTIRRGGFVAVALTGLLLTSGCVLPNTPDKIAQLEETNDPLEPTNRYFFELNRFLDEFVFKPTATWYQGVLPQPAQDTVQRFLSNMRLPWTAVNDLLQGNGRRAYVAAARFTINTTVGVAGLFDVATKWGFPHHDEDLGQTFGAWGAGEGPYLMLPLFGPSNVRDAVGLVGDFFLDPVNIVVTDRPPGSGNEGRLRWFPTARGGLEGIDLRARNMQVLSDLEKQSIDFYATIRSVYRQRRAAQIQNRGEDPATSPAPRMSGEPGKTTYVVPPAAPAAPRAEALKPAQ